VRYAFARRSRCTRRSRSRTTTGAGEGGWTVAPHWRRDHWRAQPCGPGRQERRRVAIPSVLVNGHLFVGGRADTVATYRWGIDAAAIVRHMEAHPCDHSCGCVPGTSPPCRSPHPRTVGVDQHRGDGHPPPLLPPRTTRLSPPVVPPPVRRHRPAALSGAVVVRDLLLLVRVTSWAKAYRPGLLASRPQGAGDTHGGHRSGAQSWGCG